MHRSLPNTHIIDPERAMRTLDHAEMIALSEMYARWAFNETNLDGDQRTKLIQWSADYEQIAAFCGQGWKASAPETPPDPVAFVARIEAKERGLYAQR